LSGIPDAQDADVVEELGSYFAEVFRIPPPSPED
jgi:hypothetical protein